MADPTASSSIEPGTDAPGNEAAGAAGSPGSASSGAAADDGVDLGRRRFFRQFAGEIATTAGSLAGVAQALQRTSAELAGAILDPSQLDSERPAIATPPAESGPVFRTAFRVEGAAIQFVDQRALPRSLIEYKAASAAEVTVAIRNGVVNGGPAAGQAAALGMALTAARLRGTRPYARRATFRGATNALRNAAPANGAVATAVDRVMSAYARIGELSEDGEAIAAAMQAEADSIVEEAVADHGALAEAGLAFLANLPRADAGGSLRVLIHGPGGTLAGGQFGTALSIAVTAHQREIPIRVVVPEGRPRFVGSRISSWELSAASVPHVLVADAAAPSLIAAGEVDVVLIPADRVAANGDVAAAVGTYPLAVVARRHGVPVVACVAASVIDAATPDGAGIPAGSFDAEELERFEKIALTPAGTETRTPTHDVTPAELITTWLMAAGPRTPPFAPPVAPPPVAPPPVAPPPVAPPAPAAEEPA